MKKARILYSIRVFLYLIFIFLGLSVLWFNFLPGYSLTHQYILFPQAVKVPNFLLLF